MQSDEMTFEDIKKIRTAILREPASLEQIRKAAGLSPARVSEALDALERAGDVKVLYTRNARGKIFCTRYQLAATGVRK